MPHRSTIEPEQAGGRVPLAKSTKTPRAVLESVLVALYIVVCLWLVHWDTFTSHFALTPGGVGDAMLCNYILEHDYRWMIGAKDHQKFWDSPIYYPVPHTAAFTVLLIGGLPFYAAGRSIGLAPDSAFQFFILANSFVNLLAAYLLLRLMLKRGPIGSAGGAFLLTFAGPRLAVIGHPQLWIYIFVLGSYTALHLILERSSERVRAIAGFVLLTLCLCGQLYTDIYYLWFMIFCGTIALVYAMTVGRFRSRLLSLVQQYWPCMGAVASAGVIAALPAVLAYQRTLQLVGGRSYAEVTGFLPHLKGWLAVVAVHPLYGTLERLIGIGPEYRERELLLGTGLVTLGLAIAGAVRNWKRAEMRIWIVVSIAVIALSYSWPFNESLWVYVYRFFPGAQAVRVVGRIVMILLLPMSLGLAFMIDWLGARFHRIAAVLAVAIVMVEQLPAATWFTKDHYNKLHMRHAVRPMAKLITPDCKTFVLSFRAGSTSVPIMHVLGMWAELYSNVPTMNGYTGLTPPRWPLEDVSVDAEGGRARMLHEIRTWIENYGDKGDTVCWIDGNRLLNSKIEPDDMQGTGWFGEIAATDLLQRGVSAKERMWEFSLDQNSFIRRLLSEPEFQMREVATFRQLKKSIGAIPSYTAWAKALGQLGPDGSSQADSGEIPPEVVYYCLLHRAPLRSEPVADLKQILAYILNNREFALQLQ